MNQLPSTDSPISAGITLTRDDVERLLHNDSPASRSVILDKVASHYNAKDLTAREQEVAEEIFRLLMRDISLQVRETLAEQLQHNAEIPRDIVLHLAADVESVAVPVLKASKVLSDADLVSLVEASRDIGKLLAISEREKVSSRVSAALVDTHYNQVVTTLLGNRGAALSEQSLTTIAEEFSSEKEVMQAMAAHPALPITVVERLIRQAGDDVANELKARYHIDETALRKDTTKVQEELMLRLLEDALSESEVSELVMRMAENGTLTPSVMMTALCRGQLSFFTMAVAQAANVSPSNTKRLLADRGSFGFEGIYKKSGLPESMADAVQLLLHAVQDLEAEHIAPGTKLYANRLIARVVDMAGEQPIDHLPYFMALIRQNVYRK